MADLWSNPRHRFAVYHAIVAALRTNHPRRFDVALALERLLDNCASAPDAARESGEKEMT